MKKVIVIDDPKTCRFCVAYGGETWCRAARREFPQSTFALLNRSDNYKPAWCPLRDLPEHKLDWRSGDDGYESGWNDVLDLIGGAE